MVLLSFKTYMNGGSWSYKPSHGHRSGLEDKIAAQLKAHGDEENYECAYLNYTIPESVHRYTPDFVMSNGIIIEAKGIWESKDRQKHLFIKEQYPELDVRFVFSNPKDKLYKGSTTTYADWCDAHGFKWATKVIPSAWFEEDKKSLEGLIQKQKKK